MLIQFYDRGSPPGKRLFADLENICQRLQITPDPEYIREMHRIYSMGIQGKSVLLINGQTALVDKFPSAKELESIIQDYLDDDY